MKVAGKYIYIYIYIYYTHTHLHQLNVHANLEYDPLKSFTVAHFYIFWICVIAKLRK